MAFNGASSSSSFSSSFTHQWAYDVFLSFRGEDTRNNFTAHLHAALDRKGINTYIDNDLERGEDISPALLKAIKESRISVIVLSQNYASSSWCLDELVTILECKKTKGQIILPVFYKVEPSEVRHQRKSFEEAFVKHEERFKDDQMKVQRWKTALTEVANLSGYNLENDRNEHDFIQEIIEMVNSILVKETKFQVAQYLIGIESNVQAVKLLLDIEKKDKTCMVGIFGTGGIGKTTLAKAIFNSIASQFESSCFLRDIRETCGQKGGLIRLHNELLSKILGGSSPMVDDDDHGVTLIKRRLHRKKILLVLDDVDQSVQLEKLAGKTDWFGLGSKIIITTRDKHLLHDRVDSAYEVKLLDYHKALQLFSWNAFKCDKPNVGYEEVTEDAVSYCGGLPLALTMLGSALKGNDIAYWKSKLDEYKRNPDKKIQEILRISYDGLNYVQKDIFLDIACFFKGEKLEKCDFFPRHVIQELVNKSLISIDRFETLIMHDLLQEVGREIVRQESLEPGERSRLWFHEDVRHVLEDNTGTNKVEGILIDFSELDQIQYSSPKAFKKMKRLRYIIIRNAHFSEEPTFLSNELRLIDWSEYPGESFPSNFHGKNLVVLRMPHSHFRELKGLQHFQKLTTIDFSYCDFLEKIPDVSNISNLKSLKLYICKNLVEVHRSVGLLDKLVKLEVFLCKNLRSFPKSLKLRSLKSVTLLDCSRLMKFPEIECKMECLEHIYSDFNIKELISSICLLLEDNRQAIEKSSISSGTELFQQLPLTNTSDSNDDSFSNVFPVLRNLSLSYCTLLESNFLRAFGCASKLSYLNLSGSDIFSLPRGIESFVRLKQLSLCRCKQLKEILGLPPNIEYVFAWDCVSLEIMRWDPPEPVGVEVVNWRFYWWRYLNLKGCMQLRKIPKLPPRIEKVYLGGCTSLERLPFNNIHHDLRRLQMIDFSDCPEHLRNDLPMQLFSKGYHNKLSEFLYQPAWIEFSSEGHPTLRFECIYPGNMISDWFSYRKEVLNTNSCEIDINEPQPFDFENTIFAFSAVFGFGTEDEPDGDYSFQICVGVINDGQKIFSTSSDFIEIDKSDHVWLHYEVPYLSHLKTNNFRVEFTLKLYFDPDDYDKTNPLKSGLFKSCGFHLVHRYEEKAVDSMDGIQHSKRHRDDDDDGNLESNRYPQPKRGNLEFQM